MKRVLVLWIHVHVNHMTLICDNYVKAFNLAYKVGMRMISLFVSYLKFKLKQQ